MHVVHACLQVTRMHAERVCMRQACSLPFQINPDDRGFRLSFIYLYVHVVKRQTLNKSKAHHARQALNVVPLFFAASGCDDPSGRRTPVASI
jgi:hypothetical protein